MKLEVRDLGVWFADRRVVEVDSLELDRGETLGLVGETGSGKSMTAYAIAGLAPGMGARVEGSVQLDGRELTTLSHGGRYSSAGLSRMFGVKPQTMIKQIAMLEGGGLIERNLAKGSKRVLEVTMTEAGRVALRACDKAATAVEADIFASFEPWELDTYRALMQKLLASMRRAPSEADEQMAANET